MAAPGEMSVLVYRYERHRAQGRRQADGPGWGRWIPWNYVSLIGSTRRAITVPSVPKETGPQSEAVALVG